MWVETALSSLYVHCCVLRKEGFCFALTFIEVRNKSHLLEGIYALVEKVKMSLYENANCSSHVLSCGPRKKASLHLHLELDHKTFPCCTVIFSIDYCDCSIKEHKKNCLIVSYRQRRHVLIGCFVRQTIQKPREKQKQQILTVGELENQRDHT